MTTATMTEYETTLVLRPDISGEVIEGTLDKVRETVANGGKLLAINHWGKKRLAYEVAKHSRGVYVHTHYLGAGAVVAEIERNLRLSENVLRFLTVKIEDGVAPEDRESREYVTPEYDAVMAADDDRDDRDDTFGEGAADDEGADASDEGAEDDRDA